MSDPVVRSLLQRPGGRPVRVALVPCAGSGSRSGADRPKQYVEVAGRSVVHWTLQALLDTPGLDGVALVLSPGDTGFDDAVPAPVRQRVAVLSAGGATRAHSVLNGLQALAHAGLQAEDWVLVHDAARCLVQPAAVERLLQACEGDAVGGLLAQPLPDTLKRDDGQQPPRAAATVPRQGIWAAQTPQMFRMGPLSAALEHALQAGHDITDEASAIERTGARPLLVEGGADNFKLTYPEDFQRAERILLQRRSAQGFTAGEHTT